MATKWKAYRLANYVVGFFYLLKLFSVISFATSTQFTKEDIIDYIPFLLVNVLLLTTLYLNLQILHGLFPDRKLSERKKNTQLTSFLLLLACMIAENSYFWVGMGGMKSGEHPKEVIIIRFVWIFFLLLEICILIGQITIWKMTAANKWRQYEELLKENEKEV